jgi:hypothetical protein
MLARVGNDNALRLSYSVSKEQAGQRGDCRKWFHNSPTENVRQTFSLLMCVNLKSAAECEVCRSLAALRTLEVRAACRQICPDNLIDTPHLISLSLTRRNSIRAALTGLST